MASITLHCHNGHDFGLTCLEASQIVMIQEAGPGCDATVPPGTATTVVTTFARLYAAENVEAIRASIFAAAGQDIANRAMLYHEITHLIRTMLGNGRQDTH
jgi:hypothetical protein